MRSPTNFDLNPISSLSANAWKYGPITIGPHKCTIFFISKIKTRAIASVLTPLIDKFECISEGHV